MNGIGWITVAEAARLCGTDELRITLWMNGNHIAYARFDGILMIDGASLAALFSRNRVATIYEDVAQQRGKPGRPGRLRRLLDTPLDTFGLSQRIVRACRELGVRAVVLRADVADAAACDAMVAQVLEQLGRLDILVNNAGITRDTLVLRMKDEDFDAVVNTNLRGAFLFLREAAKIMIRQRCGRIINISSVVGQMGNAGLLGRFGTAHVGEDDLIAVTGQGQGNGATDAAGTAGNQRGRSGGIKIAHDAASMDFMI